MNALDWEIRNTQNAAFGGTLLWRFACGFRRSHPLSEHVSFQLLFIVLPLLLHEPTYEFLKGTWKSSGLHAFVSKFSESKHSKQDLLLAIHGRAEVLRELTLESFRLAQWGRLLLLNPDGRVICLTETETSAGDSATTVAALPAPGLRRHAGRHHTEPAGPTTTG